MAKYIPPCNFNMVYNGIYRSTIPTDLNFPFLERLKLKAIIYLSSLPMSDELKAFCDDFSISIIQIPKNSSSMNHLHDINENLVVSALKELFNQSNLPLLITSELGSRKTGIVVSCFRKKQKWNLSSIFEEYRRYDGPKADLDSEQFIELFDPDLISVPEEEYSTYGLC